MTRHFPRVHAGFGPDADDRRPAPVGPYSATEELPAKAAAPTWLLEEREVRR